MTKENKFQSSLSRHIENFIKEKRSLGYKYLHEARAMREFDKYWAEHGYEETGLTADNLSDWVRKKDSERGANLNFRIGVVREFSRYLNGLSIPSYIPPLEVRCEKPVRHLLTPAEIHEIFSQIDGRIFLHGKRCAAHIKRIDDEYPVLFRLIYLNGMRVSETCKLPVSQIDTDSGAITVLNGKGNKDRLIYLSDDMRRLCSDYLNHLRVTLGFTPKWAFPGRNIEEPLNITTVERAFDFAWNRTSFAESCHKKPSVHDLRHAYVVRRINLWLEQGLDFEHMLPYLSKFLGHHGFNETFYYYHYTEEAAKTIRKMDTVIGKVIPEVMRR